MVKNCLSADLINELESLNVCQRCILRFLGVKTYPTYISKTSVQNTITQFQNNSTNCSLQNICASSELNEANVDEAYPSPKRHLPSPCASCLGILQDSCDEMIAKIENILKEKGHHFKDFVLQLSLPVAVDLRHHLFLHHLEKKIGSDNNICDIIPSVKDVWKWIVGSQLGASTNSDFTPDSNLQIMVPITYQDTVKECEILFKSCPEAFPNRQKRKAKLEDIYTRTAVSKAMEILSESLKQLYPYPPSSPIQPCSYGEIQCLHSPLYLGGRYNKYSRELSQTPWLVDGIRRMDSSVNELITDVVQMWIANDKIIFSASGREDVDVQMLGNGRPFILEILNPRRMSWTLEEIKCIENAINVSTTNIAVRDLQVITKKDISFLKEGEEQKRKSYSALCFVVKSLDENDIIKLSKIKDLKLQQKTPLRVLHRRTLATRERLIHSIEAKILNEHQLQIKVETQAGTYVKEFVHGDFGRTTPHLGTLLDTKADIIELDVESIHLDWPPDTSTM